MRSQKRALREYQQALIDAYYDAWMKEMLEPLYEAFQQRKRGDFNHNDLTELSTRYTEKTKKSIVSSRKAGTRLSLASRWIATGFQYG